MIKETSKTKTETQTEAEKPVVLKDDALDRVEGGVGKPGAAGDRKTSS